MREIKKLLIVFLLGVSFCLIPVSSIAEQTKNGYWWNELNKEQKLFFLFGYHTALEDTYQGFWIGSLVKFMEENPDASKAIPEGWFKYAKAVYNYYIEYEQLAGFQYRQIIDGIDTFYNDFRNKTIDITDAIKVVAMQLHNRPEEEIKRFIRGLREPNREKEGYESLGELKKK